MKVTKYILIAGILSMFVFTGYQCSSTELTSGRLYIQQRNYDMAIQVLEKEVSKNPNSAEGYYWLAVAYSEKEDYKNMIQAANNSLKINNQWKGQLDDLKVRDWAKAFNQGATFFKRAADAANDDTTKVLLGRSANAFKTAIMIIPDSGDAYKNLAYVYMSAGDFDAAIEPLQQNLNMDKSPEAYRYLGDIYYQKGQEATDKAESERYYNRAIEILEEGRKEYPSDPEILLVLSNTYIAANKIDVALEAFKAGVQQDPDNKSYRYNYGVLLLGSSDYAGAEEQFLAALSKDPEYFNALYNIGVTYIRWGTAISKEAEEKKDMTNTEYRKKYEAAIPHLEKAAEINEKDSPTWELLGKVYSVLGMTDKATVAFENADKYR
jgi:tetratricopeptide (TPR) repeat protein